MTDILSDSSTSLIVKKNHVADTYTCNTLLTIHRFGFFFFFNSTWTLSVVNRSTQKNQQPTVDGLQNPEKASGNRTLQILHTHTSGGQCLRQQHTNKELNRYSVPDLLLCLSTGPVLGFCVIYNSFEFVADAVYISDLIFLTIPKFPEHVCLTACVGLPPSGPK